jgi:cell division transport system ATP-binding protein
MIRFQEVSKQYPSGALAVNDVTFSIDDGEFIFLIGSSGAGKTTILRMMDREIKPTKGTIVINDLEINTLPKSKIPHLRRSLGFIFQDFKLLTERTVWENIAVALEILDKSKSDMEKQITEVLNFVQLSHKANYFPKQLSLGEQQRITIARAIVGGSKILLADEPTGNLDPKTSWEILKILTTLNKMGSTIIMATHNVDIVNSMKKRVIQLSNGKIVKDAKKSNYS